MASKTKAFDLAKAEQSIGLVLARRAAGGGVLSLDFDGCSERFVRKELWRLIRIFKLGNCVLSTSSVSKDGGRNFHAIFFWNNLLWGKKFHSTKEVRTRSIIQVIGEARGVDAEFKKFTELNGYLRPRISKMTGEIKVIKSPFHVGSVGGDFLYRHYRQMVERLKKP